MTGETTPPRDPESNDASSPTIAFVTVSYGPDRDRCELLCRSVEALAPSVVAHWLIVERSDLPRFKNLESGFRHLLVTEDVVPSGLMRLPMRRVGFRSDIFVTPRTKPIRGWLLQQLAKLAICREIPADVIVHVDSDVTLMRPFQPSMVVGPDGRAMLYRVPGSIHAGLPTHVEWHRTAERLLGLPTMAPPLPDFITHLVPWRRDSAAAMLELIEDRHGSWVRAVANAWKVSEYILYGRFITDVLRDTAGHVETSTSLCRDYWGSEHLTAQQIDEMLDAMGPEEVALSITAKAGIPAQSYAALLESRWATAS